MGGGDREEVGRWREKRENEKGGRRFLGRGKWVLCGRSFAGTRTVSGWTARMQRFGMIGRLGYYASVSCLSGGAVVRAWTGTTDQETGPDRCNVPFLKRIDQIMSE